MLLRAGNPNTCSKAPIRTITRPHHYCLPPEIVSTWFLADLRRVPAGATNQPDSIVSPIVLFLLTTLATWRSFVAITSHDENATVHPQKAPLSVSKMYRPQRVTSTGSRAKVWEVLLSIQWQSFWVLKSDTQVVLLTPGLCFLHRKIPCFSGKFVSNIHSPGVANKTCGIWRGRVAIAFPAPSTA